VVSFMHRPLYPQGREPLVPLNRRLGGPQSRSGRGREEKNSRESNPRTPIVQPVVTGQNFIHISHFSMRPACPAYLNFPDLIVLIIGLQAGTIGVLTPDRTGLTNVFALFSQPSSIT
jgi:hypothetical protein